LLAALGWLAATIDPAGAYSQSRVLLHRAAVDEFGTAFPDPHGDVRMLAAVFARAGVAAPVVSRVVAGGGDAGALMTALCAPVSGHAPAAPASSHFPADPAGSGPAVGPAPGDLLLYARAGGVRVAMAVTEIEVLVRGDDGRAQIERLRAVTGDDRVQGDVPRIGQLIGSCRLSSSVVPDAADLSVPAGRVALGDVGADLDHFADLQAHPRDADVSWGHRIRSAFGQLAGTLLQYGSRLIGMLGTTVGQALEWLHDHLGLGFYASAFLAPWLIKRGLTATVDLRPLHAALVWLGAALIALSPLGIAVGVTTGLFVALGWITGCWSPRNLATTAAAVVWNTAVFGVDLATGIDGTKPSSIALVCFCLVTDVLLFAKPTAAAMGVARMAGRWQQLRAGFTVVGRVAEVVMPPIVKVTTPLDTVKGWFQLQPTAIASGVLRRHVTSGCVQALDVVTVPWRGISTAPGAAIDGTTGLGEWGARRIGSALAREPGSRELILQAVIPGLRSSALVYQTHGVARATVAAAGGVGPPVWEPPKPTAADDAWIRRLQASLQRRN
jgi:hypothetical protein